MSKTRRSERQEIGTVAEEETKRAPRRPLARKEKVSGVELAKRASRHLRGGIRESLVDGECVEASRESEPLYGVFAESVPLERLVARVEPLLEDWAERRLPKEGLGDFYDRCLRGAGRRDLLSGAKGAGSAGSERPPARAESAR